VVSETHVDLKSFGTGGEKKRGEAGNKFSWCSLRTPPANGVMRAVMNDDSDSAKQDRSSKGGGGEIKGSTYVLDSTNLGAPKVKGGLGSEATGEMESKF